MGLFIPYSFVCYSFMCIKMASVQGTYPDQSWAHALPGFFKENVKPSLNERAFLIPRENVAIPDIVSKSTVGMVNDRGFIDKTPTRMNTIRNYILNPSSYVARLHPHDLTSGTGGIENLSNLYRFGQPTPFSNAIDFADVEYWGSRELQKDRLDPLSNGYAVRVLGESGMQLQAQMREDQENARIRELYRQNMYTLQANRMEERTRGDGGDNPLVDNRAQAERQLEAEADAERQVDEEAAAAATAEEDPDEIEAFRRSESTLFPPVDTSSFSPVANRTRGRRRLAAEAEAEAAQRAAQTQVDTNEDEGEDEGEDGGAGGAVQQPQQASAATQTTADEDLLARTVANGEARPGIANANVALPSNSMADDPKGRAVLAIKDLLYGRLARRTFANVNTTPGVSFSNTLIPTSFASPSDIFRSGLGGSSRLDNSNTNRSLVDSHEQASNAQFNAFLGKRNNVAASADTAAIASTSNHFIRNRNDETYDGNGQTPREMVGMGGVEYVAPLRIRETSNAVLSAVSPALIDNVRVGARPSPAAVTGPLSARDRIHKRKHGF